MLPGEGGYKPLGAGRNINNPPPQKFSIPSNSRETLSDFLHGADSKHPWTPHVADCGCDECRWPLGSLLTIAIDWQSTRRRHVARRCPPIVLPVLGPEFVKGVLRVEYGRRRRSRKNTRVLRFVDPVPPKFAPADMVGFWEGGAALTGLRVTRETKVAIQAIASKVMNREGFSKAVAVFLHRAMLEWAFQLGLDVSAIQREADSQKNKGRGSIKRAAMVSAAQAAEKVRVIEKERAAPAGMQHVRELDVTHDGKEPAPEELEGYLAQLRAMKDRRKAEQAAREHPKPAWVRRKERGG